jgi:hypothetical protein
MNRSGSNSYRHFFIFEIEKEKNSEETRQKNLKNELYSSFEIYLPIEFIVVY